MKKATITVGVREFRERLAAFLGSDVPVMVTHHGETVGVYIPVAKRPRTPDVGDLKAAADRLAEQLREMGVTEEELVESFKQFRRRPKSVARASSSL
jgi:antitoxin (DNA-binding transcriptional repressor) of toxin-antitoxin stability system